MSTKLSSYLNYLPAVYLHPENTSTPSGSVTFLSHYLTIFEKIFSGVNDSELAEQKGMGELLSPFVIGNLFYTRFSFLFGDNQQFIPPLDETSLQTLSQYIPPLNYSSSKFERWLLAFLDWLAAWVGLVLDQTWDINKKRLIIAKIIPIYRSRGTLAGLQQLLDLSIDPDTITIKINNPSPVPMLRVGVNFILQDNYVPEAPLVGGKRPWLFIVDVGLNSTLSVENNNTLVNKAKAIIDKFKPEFSYYQTNILA